MSLTILTHDDLQTQSADGDLALARRLLSEAAPDAEDPELEADRGRVLEFCANHPDALYRTCLDGHLTGSGIVIDPETGRTLLIHHRKLDRWLQPGGHADGEGNLALVAANEVSEETGLGRLSVVLPAIDVDIHLIPARPGEPAHYHLDLRFVVLCQPRATAVPNQETKGARWHPLDGAVAADSDLARTARRAATVCRALGIPVTQT